MAMEAGLDTGPVLLERKLTIGLRDNANTLGQRLSELTAGLMVEAMPLIETAGPGSEADRLAKLGVVRQGDDSVYARMLGKEDFLINWEQSALSIHRKVMGLFPGAATRWKGKRLKVTETEPLIRRLADQLSPEAATLADQWGLDPDQDAKPSTRPGQILAVAPEHGLIVATQGCPVLIREAQLEGKARATGRQLIQQLQAVEGDRLGD